MMMMMNSHLKYVDHTYRDFSRYIEEGGKLIKHKKSHNNFPARLHKMLSDNNEDVIAWMPHGRAWKIVDKERLISDVIPNYYVCKKYESFTRQLNGWGFKRLHQSGPDFGCYYHESLLRGKPKLTCLIRRLPPNLGKSTPFAEGEPNFYRISEAYPLPPPGSQSDDSTSEEATDTPSANPQQEVSKEQQAQVTTTQTVSVASGSSVRGRTPSLDLSTALEDQPATLARQDSLGSVQLLLPRPAAAVKQRSMPNPTPVERPVPALRSSSEALGPTMPFTGNSNNPSQHQNQTSGYYNRMTNMPSDRHSYGQAHPHPFHPRYDTSPPYYNTSSGQHYYGNAHHGEQHHYPTAQGGQPYPHPSQFHHSRQPPSYYQDYARNMMPSSSTTVNCITPLDHTDHRSCDFNQQQQPQSQLPSGQDGIVDPDLEPIPFS